ncbi:MAG: 1-deoxy-D-xylulose-5-phosphate synthase N-terminal domain-containing protein, partial [Nanoarchaeota archaeon]
KKLNKEEGKVYCIISDGECQIGSFYESLLIAKQHELSNLIVLCDNNSWQAMGRIKDILNIEPLNEKIKSFGWAIQKINGHDHEQIENALKNVDKTLPNFIICDTIKGMGYSKFYDNNLYHYKRVSEEELNEALKELC